MGFYNDKVNSYKGLNCSEEELDKIKGQMLDKFAKQYGDLIEELKISRRIEKYGGFSDDELMHRCVLAETELQFVNTLDRDDLFRYLAICEHSRLSKMLTHSTEKIAELSKQIQVYANKENLVAKASSIFGLDKRKISKTEEALEDEQAKLKVTKEFLDSYQSLSQDDKLKYVIGRFVFDRKIRFDKTEFERHKNMAKMQAIIDKKNDNTERLVD